MMIGMEKSRMQWSRMKMVVPCLIFTLAQPYSHLALDVLFALGQPYWLTGTAGYGYFHLRMSQPLIKKQPISTFDTSTHLPTVNAHTNHRWKGKMRAKNRPPYPNFHYFPSLWPWLFFISFLIFNPFVNPFTH